MAIQEGLNQPGAPFGVIYSEHELKPFGCGLCGGAYMTEFIEGADNDPRLYRVCAWCGVVLEFYFEADTHFSRCNQEVSK